MSYTNRYGVEVYHDTDKLIENITEDGETKTYEQPDRLPYDGAMLPVDDAMARYDRDRGLQEKYMEAEKALDDEQLTWTEVGEELHPEGRNHRSL